MCGFVMVRSGKFEPELPDRREQVCGNIVKVHTRAHTHTQPLNFNDLCFVFPEALFEVPGYFFVMGVKQILTLGWHGFI